MFGSHSVFEVAEALVADVIHPFTGFGFSVFLVLSCLFGLVFELAFEGIIELLGVHGLDCAEEEEVQECEERISSHGVTVFGGLFDLVYWGSLPFILFVCWFAFGLLSLGRLFR